MPPKNIRLACSRRPRPKVGVRRRNGPPRSLRQVSEDALELRELSAQPINPRGEVADLPRDRLSADRRRDVTAVWACSCRNPGRRRRRLCASRTTRSMRGSTVRVAAAWGAKTVRNRDEARREHVGLRTTRGANHRGGRASFSVARAGSLAPSLAPVRSRTRQLRGTLTKNESGREDLNLRLHGPEPCALPGCATPRKGTRLVPVSFGAVKRSREILSTPSARRAAVHAGERPEVVALVAFASGAGVVGAHVHRDAGLTRGRGGPLAREVDALAG